MIAPNFNDDRKPVRSSPRAERLRRKADAIRAEIGGGGRNLAAVLAKHGVAMRWEGEARWTAAGE